MGTLQLQRSHRQLHKNKQINDYVIDSNMSLEHV